MMHKGVILIEIMIGMLIAALLATGLLNMIMQVTRMQQTVTNISTTYGRIAIFEQQMARDLTGAFVPTQYDPLPIKDKKEETKIKPLEHIFTGVSKGEGGRMESLTFITCNPLEIFFGIKDIKLKPRVARVVYRLIQDKKRKTSYALFRQEGFSSLAFDNYKEDAQGEFRAYEMVDGIQALSMRFISVEEKKDKESKKVSYTYKTMPDWKAVEEKKSPQPKKGVQPPEPPRPRLPHYVEFTVSLWDSTYENAKTFVMTIPIESQYLRFEQPKEKKKPEGEEEKEKEDEKTEVPPDTAEEKGAVAGGTTA